jgi:hypothetical protein
MQRTDKLLIGLVTGIVVVVLAALASLWLRPPPAYLADDTPEHIAHNYLLAMQQADHARAYSYLLPTLAGYPSRLDAFTTQVENNRWQFHLVQGATTFDVQPAVVSGDSARVPVRQRVFYQGGLFGSGNYEDTFIILLRRLSPGPGPDWQVVDAGRIWLDCWGQARGC